MLPCAILCGGLATRLRPMTDTIPKSLIPIKGQPFLSHQLKLLRRSGIEEVVLCTGYLGKMIQDFVEDGSKFKLRVGYSFDGAQLLGTAGSIRKALPLLGRSFFVLYGDSYLPCEYRAIAETFTASGVPGLMTIYRNEGHFDTSNVEAANGRIVRYDKRNRTSAMQYIDYGLGAFRASVFERIPSDTPYDLAKIYQNLLREGKLSAFEVHERFYEIGSAQGISELEQYLSK